MTGFISIGPYTVNPNNFVRRAFIKRGLLKEGGAYWRIYVS